MDLLDPFATMSDEELLGEVEDAFMAAADVRWSAAASMPEDQRPGAKVLQALRRRLGLEQTPSKPPAPDASVPIDPPDFQTC